MPEEEKNRIKEPKKMRHTMGYKVQQNKVWPLLGHRLSIKNNQSESERQRERKKGKKTTLSFLGVPFLLPRIANEFVQI